MLSLYSALLAQHSRQLTPVRCAEPTIVQLHRYFEDVVLENNLAALVVESLLPETHRSLREISRVREVGHLARYAFFFTAPDDALSSAVLSDGATEREPILLHRPDGGESRERFVVIADARFSALMASVRTEDEEGQESAGDEVIWSFEPDIVYSALEYPDGDDNGQSRRHSWAWLLGGLAALTIGGELLGNGLQAVVSRSSISATLLGNTAIAALTEAEEIGRIAVPARRGRPDVATANIGGTAIHFLTLNAGILALVSPLHLDDATMQLHLPVAVGAPPVFCLILLTRGGLGRLEGSVLSALYVAYIAVAVAGTFGWPG